MRLNRPLFPDPLLVEEIFGAATCFGLSLGLSQVILEEDPQQLVHDITKEDESWSAVGMVVGDIKTKLKHHVEWAAHRVRKKF